MTSWHHFFFPPSTSSDRFCGFSGFSEASVGDSIQEEAEEGGNRGEWMGCIAAVLDGNKLKMMQPFLLVPRSWGIPSCCLNPFWTYLDEWGVSLQNVGSMVWLHSWLCQNDGTSPKPMMNLPLGFVREWDNPNSHGLIIIFSFKINIWYTICLEFPHIWSIAHHSFTLSVKRPLLRALGFWKGHSASRD